MLSTLKQIHTDRHESDTHLLSHHGHNPVFQGETPWSLQKSTRFTVEC